MNTEFTDGDIVVSYIYESKGFSVYDKDMGDGAFMKLSTARKFAQWILKTYPPPAIHSGPKKAKNG